MLATIDREKHQYVYAHMYEPGVLDPDVHYKLVEDFDHYLSIARVRPEFVINNMDSIGCGEVEQDWVRGIRKHASNRIAGLAFIGSKNVADRMGAIVGACLRNYIDARIITVQELLRSMKDGDAEDPTVLLIPNFFIGKQSGGDLPTWQVSQLLGLLYQRFFDNRLTVIYVQDMNALAEGYGLPFKEHVEKNYEKAV
jgi:hypothetical protein